MASSVSTNMPAQGEVEPVGYKRPPKGARWKPGQSGNPRGRPKGSRSLSTLLGDELSRPLPARIGGRLTSMSRREALVQKLIEQALKGDLRAMALLIKLDPLSAKESAEREDAPEPPLSAAEAAVLNSLLGRASAQEGPQP